MTSIADPSASDPEADAGRSLRQYASAVWRRRAWIALLVGLGAIGGFVRGRRMPDVYAVRTEINITRQRPFGLSPSGGPQVIQSFGEGYFESQIYYPTQYRLLASGQTVARLFGRRAGPGGAVAYPMWDWLTWPAWSDAFPWADDRATAAELESAYGPPILGPAAFEQLVRVPLSEFRARFAFQAHGPLERRSPSAPFRTPDDVRALLEDRIEVEPVKGTALVDIELSGERREILAPALNLLIETFSREQRSDSQRRLALERVLVEKQRELLVGPVAAAAEPSAASAPAGRGALRAAERALVEWETQYLRTSNELELRRKVLSSQIEDGEQQIRSLSDRLASRRGELVVLVPDHVPDGRTADSDEAAAVALRERLDAAARIPAGARESPFHAMPFVLADKDVASLRAKVAGLSSAGTIAGAAQADLNLAVAQTVIRTALPLAADLDLRAAKRRQYDVDLRELARSWTLASDLGRLQAEVDRRTKDLAALDDRRERILTQESVESGLQPLRVVEPATDPSRPVRPDRLLFLLGGAGAGLLLGLAFALLREWLDDSVGDREDVERHLRAPVLGTIVALGPKDEGAAAIDRISSRLPRSPVAEAFRAVRTSVEFLGTDDASGRVILVSSCSPREGKTTVASNLAAVLAQDGKRTLLIDADLRRPRVHTVFGVDNDVGLSNVIAGRTRLEEAVVATDQENLWILPSGPTPPNPAELLGRKATRALLERVGTEFDRVVVDSPPIGVVTDAAVLGRLATQVLLVVAAGRTKKRAAEHGGELLRSAGAAPTGIVLNHVARSSRFLYGGARTKDAAAYYGATDGSRP